MEGKIGETIKVKTLNVYKVRSDLRFILGTIVSGNFNNELYFCYIIT